MVIVLSLTYAGFQVAFVVCTGFSGVSAVDSINQVTQAAQVTDNVILNEGQGWTVFFFIAALLGALANAYTFLIAYFWLLIITIMVMLILLYILCVLYMRALHHS